MEPPSAEFPQRPPSILTHNEHHLTALAISEYSRSLLLSPSIVSYSQTLFGAVYPHCIHHPTSNRNTPIAACIFVACRRFQHPIRLATLNRFLRTLYNDLLREVLMLEMIISPPIEGQRDAVRVPRLAPDERKGGIWRLGNGDVGVTVEYDTCDAWLSEFCCLPPASEGEVGVGVGERGALGEEAEAGDWELMRREDGGGGGCDQDDGWELVDRDDGDGGGDAPVIKAGGSWGGVLRRALSG